MDSAILQNAINFLDKQLVPWIFSNGISIVIVIIVTWLILLVLEKLTRKLVHGLLGKHNPNATYEKKRAETLTMTLTTTFRALIIITAGISILGELGVNTTALIASAGFVGAAIGFGSQSLVKDMISGIFILIENQYRVGDYVLIAGIYGRVREMGLRTTVLYGEDGVIHYIPNGEVKQSANYSKNKSGMFFDISISAKADMYKAIEIINKTGIGLAEDKHFAEFILTPPHFARLEVFAATGAVIKITGDTIPNKQYEMAGEFRKRLLSAFNKEKIDLAEAPAKILR